MADKIKTVMSNSNYGSKSTYIIKRLRSDGRLPDRTKPATARDTKIHLSHILDSSQYNLRHEHDHGEEMAFDYKRFLKEDTKLVEQYSKQIRAVLNPVYKQMRLVIKEI